MFAQRKLVVLALHALVAACPALGFLRSAPLMGYGSTGTATTTPTLAVRAAPPAPPAPPGGSAQHACVLGSA